MPDHTRIGIARRYGRIFACLILLLASAGPLYGQEADMPESPFRLRGYYLTFMRMPVMGLTEWKAAVDCFAEDDMNVLILWMPGGFRSEKFPVTWSHNQDHANVENDFAGELIDYAHTKGIRVLLGLTPFGYDGVNRFAYEYPQLKARREDGSPVDPFGIGCWGWNLCPAQPESQRLMREYASEMLFEFYPNADGVLVESSDYAVCHCPDCGPKYYDQEFRFVRWLSDEIWSRNPQATILIYPHYFTGKPIPGLNVRAARQEFDPRWSLFFTPHSAHFEKELIEQAGDSVFWTDAAVLGTPERVAQAARTAQEHGVSGFIPSLEAFSYTMSAPDYGDAWGDGRRLRPYGLDPSGEGRMPYSSLPARVQRLACREFSRQPTLAPDQFRERLGRDVFNAPGEDARVTDLLELQRIWTDGADWCWLSPLLDPPVFRELARRKRWDADTLRKFDRNLLTLQQIASRYPSPSEAAEQELSRLAAMVVERWGTARPLDLRPSEAKQP